MTPFRRHRKHSTRRSLRTMSPYAQQFVVFSASLFLWIVVTEPSLILSVPTGRSLMGHSRESYMHFTLNTDSRIRPLCSPDSRNTGRYTPSWWSEMPWCQVSTRPSATTTLIGCSMPTPVQTDYSCFAPGSSHTNVCMQHQPMILLPET